MALVNCRECRQSVSDAALTCPHCGVTGPAGTGRLVVTRQRQLMGGIMSVAVIVDGRVVDRIKPGGELTIDLTPGRHDLVVSYPKGETTGSVDVRSGRTAHCHVEVSRWDASLKATISEE